METISFSLWKGFSINAVQTFLLLGLVAALSLWMMEKRKWRLWFSLGCCLLFTFLRSWSFAQAYGQKTLIVYNIPRYSAMDLIAGRHYSFIGDSALLSDKFIKNFHIQPSRVLYRIGQKQVLPLCCKEFEFCNKRILVIDSTQNFKASGSKRSIDILVLSKNPKLYISNLLKAFSIQQLVIDSSVPQWKAKRWKQDCDSLRIPCYNVNEKGAFVMNL